jgi:hypothetical protein
MADPTKVGTLGRHKKWFLAQGAPPSFGEGLLFEFSASDRGVQHGITASGGDGFLMKEIINSRLW